MASEPYQDLAGKKWSLEGLSPEEFDVVRDLKRTFTKSDWQKFNLYWPALVGAFYDRQGFSRKEITQTLVFRIAQDLDSRLAVNEGLASLPDYYDDLLSIIREEFKTRRAFCEATGLTETMLSHVMARRRDFSIDTLSKALEKIDCEVRIVRKRKTKSE